MPVDTIRETPIGQCIGAKLLDITTGDHGEDDSHFVYFHFDNGQTIFATIGHESNPGLMGFVDMDDEGDDDEPVEG